MNKRELIAVGVDPDNHIWGGHFGISPLYNIYEQSGKLIDKRPNPYCVGGGEEKHHDDPELILDLLHECNVFIAQKMGGRSKRMLAEKLNVVPILTGESDPDVAVSIYLKELRGYQE